MGTIFFMKFRFVNIVRIVEQLGAFGSFTAALDTNCSYLILAI
jgi:hypothetical protein